MTRHRPVGAHHAVARNGQGDVVGGAGAGHPSRVRLGARRCVRPPACTWPSCPQVSRQRFTHGALKAVPRIQRQVQPRDGSSTKSPAATPGFRIQRRADQARDAERSCRLRTYCSGSASQRCRSACPWPRNARPAAVRHGETDVDARAVLSKGGGVMPRMAGRLHASSAGLKQRRTWRR